MSLPKVYPGYSLLPGSDMVHSTISHLWHVKLPYHMMWLQFLCFCIVFLLSNLLVPLRDHSLSVEAALWYNLHHSCEAKIQGAITLPSLFKLTFGPSSVGKDLQINMGKKLPSSVSKRVVSAIFQTTRVYLQSSLAFVTAPSVFCCTAVISWLFLWVGMLFISAYLSLVPLFYSEHCQGLIFFRPIV